MIALFTAIWRSPTGRIGLVLVVAIIAFAVFGPPLIPYDPAKLDIRARYGAPSWAHFAGTDALGRDLLARLAAGGRIALGVALTTIALALSTGTTLGMLAARAGSRVDAAILVLFDTIASFPSLLFALAAIALLGPGLIKVVLLVAITLAPQFGRVARAQTLTLGGMPYVEAALTVGVGWPRMFARHLLPNIAGPLVVLASMDIPTVITLEAGLSFLGVGVPPPAASWGGLLYDGYVNLDQSIWPVAGAALMLVLATLGFTLFGEALRDAADVTVERAP
ncbi:MAG TPA: ABC transporter permease [Acetobacteraceae bacterium]|nr:ABC transporter permease [Acetobacteraceae bacterium]